MIRGTTPTFKLLLNDEEVDLTAAANIYATFKQGTVLITKTGEDLTVTEHEVDVYLNQEESLKFKEGDKLEVQLNWTYNDGKRACSNIIKIDVGRNLLGSVAE